jgi:uncharacterized protein (DUF934 family)
VAALIAACGTAIGAELLNSPGARVEFGEGDRRLAEAVPRVLDSIRAQLADELGLRGPALVRVRISRDARPFAGVAGGLPVELFAGIAYPGTGTIEINAAAMDRSGRQVGFVRTLRHEYVHLALGRTLGGRRVPKWFEEGLACAFGSPLPREEALLVTGGRGFRLQALARTFPSTKDGLALAYAQSESIVRFLVRESSLEAIGDVLRSVADGVGFDAALTSATGLTPDSLEDSWRRRSQPSGFERALRAVFGPGRVLLWTALFMVAGSFVVRYRRRRAAERLDDFM